MASSRKPPEAKASCLTLSRLTSRLEKTGYIMPDLSLGEAKNMSSLRLSLSPLTPVLYLMMQRSQPFLSHCSRGLAPFCAVSVCVCV